MSTTTAVWAYACTVKLTISGHHVVRILGPNGYSLGSQQVLRTHGLTLTYPGRATSF